MMFHRIAVSKSAFLMVEFVVILVENFDRRDVSVFAWSPRPGGFRFFNSSPTLVQFSRIWRRPKRVIIAHRDTPVAHGALRISDRNLGKCFFRFFVFKRMKPRHRTIELLLRLGLT